MTPSASEVASSLVDELCAAGIDRDIADAVFQYLRRGNWNKSRPIAAAERLYPNYGMADEDLDDAVLELAKAVGGRHLTTDDVRDCTLVTVRDLALLLQKLRQTKLA
jgi:hypothetical protein